MEREKKSKITFFWLWLFSLPTSVVGFLLQTILIPMQDMHTLSEKELAQAQQEFAINYPLGTVLMWTGLIVFILTPIILIVAFVKTEVKRRASMS